VVHLILFRSQLTGREKENTNIRKSKNEIRESKHGMKDAEELKNVGGISATTKQLLNPMGLPLECVLSPMASREAPVPRPGLPSLKATPTA
jgi:hypothetical protein